MQSTEGRIKYSRPFLVSESVMLKVTYFTVTAFLAYLSPKCLSSHHSAAGEDPNSSMEDDITTNDYHALAED